MCTCSHAHEAHLADSRTVLSRPQGILALSAAQAHLRVPFLVCHGTGDRVTSHHGSEDLHRLAESTDKELKLFPEVRARSLPHALSLLIVEDGKRAESTTSCAQYEHILLRKGRDEADDARRQSVLGAMLDWLERH